MGGIIRRIRVHRKGPGPDAAQESGGPCHIYVDIYTYR